MAQQPSVEDIVSDLQRLYPPTGDVLDDECLARCPALITVAIGSSPPMAGLGVLDKVRETLRDFVAACGSTERPDGLGKKDLSAANAIVLVGRYIRLDPRIGLTKGERATAATAGLVIRGTSAFRTDRSGTGIDRYCRIFAEALLSYMQERERSASSSQYNATRARQFGSPVGVAVADVNDADVIDWLQVHRSLDFDADSGTGTAALTAYLQRGVDEDLRLHVRTMADDQTSGLAVLVGDSATGKSRAAWEAVKAELHDWRIWHSLVPGCSAETVASAVAEGRIGERTVIWLGDAHNFLESDGEGSRLVAALQDVLALPGPRIVLATTWPEPYDRLTHETRNQPHEVKSKRQPNTDDLSPHAAAFMARGRCFRMPANFTAIELDSESNRTAIYGDARLRAAIERAPDGEIVQNIAGVPEIRRRYAEASDVDRAVLNAAVDAHRLSSSWRRLDRRFLADAARAYLTEQQWRRAQPWEPTFNTAIAKLTADSFGIAGLLVHHISRSRGADTEGYEVTDILEQQLRRDRGLIMPPAGFWDAAADPQLGLSADIQSELGTSLNTRGRARRAYTQFFQPAAQQGNRTGIAEMISYSTDRGDLPRAVKWATTAKRAGFHDLAGRLPMWLRFTGNHAALEDLARTPAFSNDNTVRQQQFHLAEKRGEDVEHLAVELVRNGDGNALNYLLARAADNADVERWKELFDLYREIGMDSFCTVTFTKFVIDVDARGDGDVATEFALSLIDGRVVMPSFALMRERELCGDRQGAESLVARAADAGWPDAVLHLIEMRADEGIEESLRLLQLAGNKQWGGEFVSVCYKLARRGHYELAMHLIGNVDDADAEKLEALVCVYVEQGLVEDAERIAERLVSQNQIVGVLKRLADYHVRNGDTPAAIGLAMRVIALGHRPDDILLHQLWAAGARSQVEAIAEPDVLAGILLHYDMAAFKRLIENVVVHPGMIGRALARALVEADDWAMAQYFASIFDKTEPGRGSRILVEAAIHAERYDIARTFSLLALNAGADRLGRSRIEILIGSPPSTSRDWARKYGLTDEGELADAWEIP